MYHLTMVYLPIRFLWLGMNLSFKLKENEMFKTKVTDEDVAEFNKMIDYTLAIEFNDGTKSYHPVKINENYGAASYSIGEGTVRLSPIGETGLYREIYSMSNIKHIELKGSDCGK